MPPFRALSWLILFLFLGSFNTHTDEKNWTIEAIDSALTKTILELRKKGKIGEAFALSQDVLNQTLQIRYQKGMLSAYYVNSNILCIIGRHKESIAYLDLALPLAIALKDEEAIIKIQIEYGRNYYLLGFFQESLTSYENARERLRSHRLEEKTRTALTDYLYASEASTYEELGDMPRFLASLREAYSMRPSPIVASRIAKYYTTYAADLDSAAHYIHLADSLFESGRFGKHQKAILLRNTGRYLVAKGKYQEAIEKYKESERISIQGNKPFDVSETCKLIYEAYAAYGDTKNSTEYIAKYTSLTDSIQKERRLLIEIPVKKIIQRQEESHNQQKRRLYAGVCALAMLVSALLVYLRRANRQKAKKSEEATLLREEIWQSTFKLNEKEKEAEILQQKVNESFEELLRLAKQNHPSFYTRFQEIYPLVHQNLVKTNPNLQLSELVLSAYVYLDFTTKEIADYTFKSVRTVQNRKYALRKRLGLSTSEDLYVWIKVLNT